MLSWMLISSALSLSNIVIKQFQFELLPFDALITESVLRSTSRQLFEDGLMLSL